MTSTTAAKSADLTSGLPFPDGNLPVEVEAATTATAQDLIRTTREASYTFTCTPGAAARRERLEGGDRAPASDKAEVARYLRRIAEQLAAALDEDADDVLGRDATIREALPLWGLAFKHCQGLKDPVQDLLSHLLTCLSSPLAAQNGVALRQLHAVVSALAQYVGGTTEKDVDALVIRLEEAGFDLTAPISALPVAEGDAGVEGRNGG